MGNGPSLQRHGAFTEAGYIALDIAQLRGGSTEGEAKSQVRDVSNAPHPCPVPTKGMERQIPAISLFSKLKGGISSGYLMHELCRDIDTVPGYLHTHTHICRKKKRIEAFPHARTAERT